MTLLHNKGAPTISDAVEAGGNVVGGTFQTAAGGLQFAVSGDDSLLKAGLKTLEYGGNKLVDAVIGKARIDGNISLNVWRPSNITVSNVHTNIEILQGALGMTLVEVF